jgi:hypothetical protein
LPNDAGGAAGRAGRLPNDENSGERELFRAYVKGRAAMYALILGGGAAFSVGAWKQSPLAMAAGPVAVVGLVILVSAIAANRAAADRFYRSFASELGLGYAERSEPLPLTPLLGAGDKRWCEHWMRGTLPGEPSFSGGVGHFVFEEIERKRGTSGLQTDHVTERRRFTVCTIDLEPSLPFFKGLYVRPRRGIFPEGEDWVRHGDTRTIELESAAFGRRYEVRIASDQEELMARQLLAPTLVNWLAEHPLQPCFEAKAGTLAVYVPKPLTDAGNLTYLLDASRHLAERVQKETEEALARPAA